MATLAKWDASPFFPVFLGSFTGIMGRNPIKASEKGFMGGDGARRARERLAMPEWMAREGGSRGRIVRKKNPQRVRPGIGGEGDCLG